MVFQDYSLKVYDTVAQKITVTSMEYQVVKVRIWSDE